MTDKEIVALPFPPLTHDGSSLDKEAFVFALGHGIASGFFNIKEALIAGEVSLQCHRAATLDFNRDPNLVGVVVTIRSIADDKRQRFKYALDTIRALSDHERGTKSLDFVINYLNAELMKERSDKETTLLKSLKYEAEKYSKDSEKLKTQLINSTYFEPGAMKKKILDSVPLMSLLKYFESRAKK